MAKGSNAMGAMVILLLAINLAFLAQPSTADDDYNSPIWDRWVDEDRGINLRPCLDLMKSAKCQVELYNYYFNISKKELDLNCCVFVKVMGKRCARAFAGWFRFPEFEVFEPNPMKVYKNCVGRLDALPPWRWIPSPSKAYISMNINAIFASSLLKSRNRSYPLENTSSLAMFVAPGSYTKLSFLRHMNDQVNSLNLSN